MARKPKYDYSDELIKKVEDMRNKKQSWLCISKEIGIPEGVLISWFNRNMKIKFVPK